MSSKNNNMVDFYSQLMYGDTGYDENANKRLSKRQKGKKIKEVEVKKVKKEIKEERVAEPISVIDEILNFQERHPTQNMDTYLRLAESSSEMKKTAGNLLRAKTAQKPLDEGDNLDYWPQVMQTYAPEVTVVEEAKNYIDRVASGEIVDIFAEEAKQVKETSQKKEKKPKTERKRKTSIVVKLEIEDEEEEKVIIPKKRVRQNTLVGEGPEEEKVEKKIVEVKKVVIKKEWLCPTCKKRANLGTCECSGCKEWYHFKCLNMKQSDYTSAFKCPDCL